MCCEGKPVAFFLSGLIPFSLRLSCFMLHYANLNYCRLNVWYVTAMILCKIVCANAVMYKVTVKFLLEPELVDQWHLEAAEQRQLSLVEENEHLQCSTILKRQQFGDSHTSRWYPSFNYVNSAKPWQQVPESPSSRLSEASDLQIGPYRFARWLFLFLI